MAATQRKRQQFAHFIRLKLEKEPAVQGVLVVGSVAAGTARDDSDFAYNRTWRIWRDREMTALLQLPWLPQRFNDHVLTALNAPSHDHAGYRARVETLQYLFHEILSRLIADGVYGDDPIHEAFVRNYDEPGRAWNMESWNEKHRSRR